MKRTAFALVVTALFAASSALAHDNAACCAGMTAKTMKGACDASFANLNLTAAQKTKMKALAAECDRGGCNEQTMAKMEKGARKVLTKEQFAQWKSACSGHSADKKQS